jgi:hypothetical protein
MSFVNQELIMEVLLVADVNPGVVALFSGREAKSIDFAKV